MVTKQHNKIQLWLQQLLCMNPMKQESQSQPLLLGNRYVGCIGSKQLMTGGQAEVQSGRYGVQIG